jgi:hypothetical protein
MRLCQLSPLMLVVDTCPEPFYVAVSSASEQLPTADGRHALTAVVMGSHQAVRTT